MSARHPRPAVFICDIQEKFRPVIFEFDKVISTARKVVRAAGLLGIPVFVTTQNRARLGDTVPELTSLWTDKPAAAGAQAVAEVPKVLVDADKTLFSMWTPEVQAVFNTHNGRGDAPLPPASVAIVGIEAHICVTQTALDLLAAGHRVYVLADGVSSSHRQEVPVALARLRAAGATVTTSEGWLYEQMGDAAILPFRSIVRLVKETSTDTEAALAALLPSKI